MFKLIPSHPYVLFQSHAKSLENKKVVSLIQIYNTCLWKWNIDYLKTKQACKVFVHIHNECNNTHPEQSPTQQQTLEHLSHQSGPSGSSKYRDPQCCSNHTLNTNTHGPEMRDEKDNVTAGWLAWPWGQLLTDQTLRDSSTVWSGAVFLSIITSRWHNFSLSQGHGGRLWKGRRHNTMIKSHSLPWRMNVERKIHGRKGLAPKTHWKGPNQIRVKHWADICSLVNPVIFTWYPCKNPRKTA